MLLFFNRSESLYCTQAFYIKLSVIPFYSEIPPKNNRQDLDRHIPQKINEFPSLALAGRYP